MAENNNRLDTLEDRLRRLEERIDRREMREAASRTTVAISGPPSASLATTAYRLPVEAVREAVSYVESNRELLETEAEIERLMLKRGGIVRGPQAVSG